jgi:hypothetical protein
MIDEVALHNLPAGILTFLTNKVAVRDIGESRENPVALAQRNSARPGPTARPDNLESSPPNYAEALIPPD